MTHIFLNKSFDRWIKKVKNLDRNCRLKTFPSSPFKTLSQAISKKNWKAAFKQISNSSKILQKLKSTLQQWIRKFLLKEQLYPKMNMRWSRGLVMFTMMRISLTILLVNKLMKLTKMINASVGVKEVEENPYLTVLTNKSKIFLVQALFSSFFLLNEFCWSYWYPFWFTGYILSSLT